MFRATIISSFFLKRLLDNEKCKKDLNTRFQRLMTVYVLRDKIYFEAIYFEAI